MKRSAGLTAECETVDVTQHRPRLSVCFAAETVGTVAHECPHGSALFNLELGMSGWLCFSFKQPTLKFQTTLNSSTKEFVYNHKPTCSSVSVILLNVVEFILAVSVIIPICALQHYRG